MRKIITISISMLLSSSLYAKGTVERIGDVLTLAVPAVAYGATLYLDDEDGQTEFYKSYGTTAVVTHILKRTVREKRPNSNSTTSFPSGHASSAFSGASFIHKRYGLKYAILPYISAIYTAYSRVEANKHYTRDVVAGAVVGIASSWYFVTPYKNLQINPVVGADYKGIQLNYKW